MNFPLKKISVLSLTMAALNLPDAKAQSSGEPTLPGELVGALHSAFGTHQARAVHAKGIILEGEFTPGTNAAMLSKSFHLQKLKSHVIVRFSDFTGIPDIPDNSGGANPRGFAIKFEMPDGATTDIIAHSFNGFPTANSEQFRDLLLAIGASGPTAAKPTALDNFLSSHPIAKTFLTTQKTPASYASSRYFGVNAFKFTNNAGVTHFVRYQFVPVDPEEYLTQDQMANSQPDYLFQEIKQRVARHSIKFEMYAQLSEAGDDVENPSVAWPDERKKVLLGVIEIKSLTPNTSVEDKALSFSPNNIPDGIEAADPMIIQRSKAYPISVRERQ